MTWLYSRIRYGVYAFKRTILWRGRHRPPRLFRFGRAVDTDFSSDELLFIRCTLDWFDAEGNVNPAYVGFPNQSTNRSKYSKPRDVLLPDQRPESRTWLLWGVVSLRVSSIPSKIIGPQPHCIEYTFSVEHEPENDNYSHSELSVYKQGKRENKGKKINQEVKKAYREHLARMLSKVVNPLVSLLPSEAAESRDVSER